MTRNAWVFIVAALLSAGASGARAAAAPSLSVVRVWSRATVPGTSVGVAYFEVINTGAADTLQSIVTPRAGRVEMHSASTVNGMMQMREMATVEIPAAAHVRFEPAGLHAMLIDLRQPLQEGERVPLTLLFSHAGSVHVTALVQGIGAIAPPAAQLRDKTEQDYRLAAWPRHAAAPAFHLVDVDGRSRTLADYRGRVVVVFFGFMHCPDACPAELFKLSLVMKKLGALREHVQVVFITLDPARDRAQQLQSYVAAFDPNFVGLTGSTAQIDDAARKFAVEYAKVGTGANYSIDHSTSTFVFDPDGALRLVGSMDTSVGDYEHDLAALAAANDAVRTPPLAGRATP